MLFFLHIPKTAGSTLNYIIKNNYGEKAQEIRWHWTKWQSEKELESKVRQVDLRGKSLVHGHFSFGFHRFINSGDSKYLTFVRDPLKKVVSGFYHVKRDKRSLFHEVYKTGRIEDYLLDSNILENDNGLVRRISGIGDQVEYGKVDADHLQLAIDNINNYFLAVGITEQFDRSVELFKSLGIFKNVCYWKQNEGSNKGRGKRGDIAEDVLRKFKELNVHDFELYRYCMEQFEVKTKDISFSQARFDFKNKLYNISLLPNKIARKVSKLFK